MYVLFKCTEQVLSFSQTFSSIINLEPEDEDEGSIKTGGKI